MLENPLQLPEAVAAAASSSTRCLVLVVNGLPVTVIVPRSSGGRVAVLMALRCYFCVLPVTVWPQACSSISQRELVCYLKCYVKVLYTKIPELVSMACN